MCCVETSGFFAGECLVSYLTRLVVVTACLPWGVELDLIVLEGGWYRSPSSSEWNSSSRSLFSSLLWSSDSVSWWSPYSDSSSSCLTFLTATVWFAVAFFCLFCRSEWALMIRRLLKVSRMLLLLLLVSLSISGCIIRTYESLSFSSFHFPAVSGPQYRCEIPLSK